MRLCCFCSWLSRSQHTPRAIVGEQYSHRNCTGPARVRPYSPSRGRRKGTTLLRQQQRAQLQQFSLWPCESPPGEGTRPTTPTKPLSCRPGALTRRPDLLHNENCCIIGKAPYCYTMSRSYVERRRSRLQTLSREQVTRLGRIWSIP